MLFHPGIDCPVEGQIRKRCAPDPSCMLTCNMTELNDYCSTEICLLNGCVCPEGTVIAEDNNTCVAPSECPLPGS